MNFKDYIGKHNDVPDSKFDPTELAMGIKVELEHTRLKSIAKLIAKDHLSEIPNYYTLLAKMEKGKVNEANEEKYETNSKITEKDKKIFVKTTTNENRNKLKNILEKDGYIVTYFADSTYPILEIKVDLKSVTGWMIGKASRELTEKYKTFDDERSFIEVYNKFKKEKTNEENS